MFKEYDKILYVQFDKKPIRIADYSIYKRKNQIKFEINAQALSYHSFCNKKVKILVVYPELKMYDKFEGLVVKDNYNYLYYAPSKYSCIIQYGDL